MKNKKIINSLDKILPNEQCKNNMLNNILTSNTKKNKINYKLLYPIVSCCFLFIFTFIYLNNDHTNKVVKRNIENEIIYKGVCYVESGLFNGDISDLEFIEETKEFIMGDKIYQKDDSIIFQNSENYIEFVKCERN